MGSVWNQSEAGHKHMLHQYIIDAMLEVVSEKGVFNISMSEFPKVAKVSRCPCKPCTTTSRTLRTS